MPYRLAIPPYERQGMSETYLSLKGVKSMRKQLNDKTRLAESNRCCVTVTLSTVEHMTRCPCSSAGALSPRKRRLHGIIKNGGQTATEALLCSGYVYIILQQTLGSQEISNKIWDSMFLTRRGISLCTTSTKSTL